MENANNASAPAPDAGAAVDQGQVVTIGGDAPGTDAGSPAGAGKQPNAPADVVPKAQYEAALRKVTELSEGVTVLDSIMDLPNWGQIKEQVLKHARGEPIEGTPADRTALDGILKKISDEPEVQAGLVELLSVFGEGLLKKTGGDVSRVAGGVRAVQVAQATQAALMEVGLDPRVASTPEYKAVKEQLLEQSWAKAGQKSDPAGFEKYVAEQFKAKLPNREAAQRLNDARDSALESRSGPSGPAAGVASSVKLNRNADMMEIFQHVKSGKRTLQFVD